MIFSCTRTVSLVTAILTLLSGAALAQSSSRILPTFDPGYPTVIPQGSTTRPGTVIPQAAPVQQGSGTRVMQGSTTRIMPGSNTRGEVIQGEVLQGEVIVDQGSTTRAMPMQGSATRSTPMIQAAPIQTFESKLWGYLLRAKYRNWAPVPGQSDAMYEGQNPHGAFLKMYLNRTAAGSPKELPNGSIVIKENFTPGKALAAITVMYKTKGYNPEAGDWYWVKYNPDGSVASKQTDKGMVRLGGRVGGCIECHSGADGNDFAYFND